jgi:hypothetical protein
MANVNAKISTDGKSLIITMPLEKATPSASGKTLIVATTSGFAVTDAKTKDGKTISVSVNATVKP